MPDRCQVLPPHRLGFVPRSVPPPLVLVPWEDGQSYRVPCNCFRSLLSRRRRARNGSRATSFPSTTPSGLHPISRKKPSAGASRLMSSSQSRRRRSRCMLPKSRSERSRLPRADARRQHASRWMRRRETATFTVPSRLPRGGRRFRSSTQESSTTSCAASTSARRMAGSTPSRSWKRPTRGARSRRSTSPPSRRPSTSR